MLTTKRKGKDYCRSPASANKTSRASMVAPVLLLNPSDTVEPLSLSACTEIMWQKYKTGKESCRLWPSVLDSEMKSSPPPSSPATSTSEWQAQISHLISALDWNGSEYFNATVYHLCLYCMFLSLSESSQSLSQRKGNASHSLWKWNLLKQTNKAHLYEN